MIEKERLANPNNGHIILTLIRPDDDRPTHAISMSSDKTSNMDLLIAGMYLLDLASKELKQGDSPFPLTDTITDLVYNFINKDKPNA